MSEIIDLYAREILDSRGNPTVEVEIESLDGSNAIVEVPSGASTGEFEAVELRDGDKLRYLGKGVENAVENINEIIAPEIIGLDAEDQTYVDQRLIELDGTKNKAKLGAHAILGVSLAAAHAGAKDTGLSLYRYLGGTNAHVLPVPCMNILNGGSHADSNVDIQEFMITPLGAPSFKEALRYNAEVYHNLKNVLKKEGLNTGLGDEGGFAPNLESNASAIEYIIKAIRNAGYKEGKDICIALDVAASEFYKDGKYQFEGQPRDHEYMIKYYEKLVKDYPLVSIEDPFNEDNWNEWQEIVKEIGDKVQIVGDDLFVTNPERIEKGIKTNAANSLLVKLNQIGTVTETLSAVELAHRAGFTTMTSHRSGETEDTTIADLSVATNSGQIKSGAPARGERVNKYNRLLIIEEELAETAIYAGANAFPRFKH
jgi:enolase